MTFKGLHSKLKRFRQIFIAPAKCWRLPKKSEILIYDACGAETLAPYLTGYSVEIIPTRGEAVNVPCLLFALLKWDFWKGNPIQAYLDIFIQLASPKVALTLIDNDPSFYALSGRFPDVKTLLLQNGTRDDWFQKLASQSERRVDYMLVHNDAIGGYYQKFISGAIMAIGSLKNNEFETVSAAAANRQVLFISQFHEKPDNEKAFFIGTHGAPIAWDEFFKAEIQVLRFLGRWCAENEKNLRICGRSTANHKAEYDFYSACLEGRNWEYIPRTDNDASYHLVNAAEIVVFIDSTLGFESIGRGKRTAAFTCRGVHLGTEARKFGWPTRLPNHGPFWTSNDDEHEFQQVMDFLNTASPEEWESVRQHYAGQVMAYDAGNVRFKTLLAQLLPKAPTISLC